MTPAPESGSRVELLQATRAALAGLQRSHSERCAAAQGPSGATGAALWGALAASAAQGLKCLEADLDVVWLPARPERTVAVLTPADASALLLARLQEACFGISAALGALGAKSDLRPRLELLLDAALGWRDFVAAAARRASVTPSPAQPAYRLPPLPHKDEEAGALAARLWDAALGAAGQWLAASTAASGPAPRDEALQALVGLAIEAVDLGAGWLDWPGWPDLG